MKGDLYFYSVVGMDKRRHFGIVGDDGEEGPLGVYDNLLAKIREASRCEVSIIAFNRVEASK